MPVQELITSVAMELTRLLIGSREETIYIYLRSISICQYFIGNFSANTDLKNPCKIVVF